MNYIAPALLCGMAVTASAQVREHAETTITLTLPGSPACAFPLFGPVRESDAGAVITIKGSTSEWVWVLATYAEAAVRAGCAIVWPGMWATKLDIALKAAAADATEASVTYCQTALSAAGDKYVKDFASHFPSEREHWEQAISHRLRELQRQQS